MQNNTIQIGEVVYDRFQEYPDRSVYTAPDHSIGLNHLLTLSRVVPTSPSAAARVRTKFVRDIVEPVTKEKGTIYVTCETSQPVWAVPTDVAAIAAALSTFMQGTEFQSLLQKQSI